MKYKELFESIINENNSMFVNNKNEFAAQFPELNKYCESQIQESFPELKDKYQFDYMAVDFQSLQFGRPGEKAYIIYYKIKNKPSKLLKFNFDSNQEILSLEFPNQK